MNVGNPCLTSKDWYVWWGGLGTGWAASFISRGDIVLAAVETTGYALQYASPRCKSSAERWWSYRYLDLLHMYILVPILLGFFCWWKERQKFYTQKEDPGIIKRKKSGGPLEIRFHEPNLEVSSFQGEALEVPVDQTKNGLPIGWSMGSRIPYQGPKLGWLGQLRSACFTSWVY